MKFPYNVLIDGVFYPTGAEVVTDTKPPVSEETPAEEKPVVEKPKRGRQPKAE